MNKNKKVLITLIVIVMAIAMCCAFVACQPTKLSVVFVTSKDAAPQTMKFSTKNYADDAKLINLFENEKNAKTIKADIDKTNPKMPFLKSIYGMVPDASYQFICVYSDQADITVEDEFNKPITVDGKVFKCVNVGIGDLPIKAGVTYVFALVDWQPKPISLKAPSGYVDGGYNIAISSNLSGMRSASFF
ncbi:MAG: hypothetical protein RR348_02395 [Clostridia bacterium]